MDKDATDTRLDFGLMLDATQFAASKHRNQRRKNSARTPYINHPLEVAHLLWFKGGIRDERVLAAAVLHDTVEDTDATIEDIESRFGSHIASIVDEVSDDKGLSFQERKQVQIEHAPHLSHEAKLVKIADKIANLRDVWRDPPEGWSESRRGDYFKWAKAVVNGCRGTNDALEALFDRTYDGFFDDDPVN